MTCMVPISARERHERENEALASAMRAHARGLVGEINRVMGEGYLFLSECGALGFFMLFERMPVLDRKQRADWGREIMSAGTDVDGYARLVLWLEERKGALV